MADVSCSLRAVGDVLRTADLLTEVRGPEDIVVRGVSQDSRTVTSDMLFVAWQGTEADAHDYVSAAVERGASAVVVERPVDVTVPQLVVRNGRRAAALAADMVMGQPSRDLTVVGVTGTNGKTTTSLLVRHLLEAQRNVAIIGTLGLLEAEGVRPGTEGLTTPGPVQVAVWLRELRDAGYDVVIVEASSHALEQHRLDAVAFDAAVFTNLTQDHLDYHGDMAAYRAAKLALVDLVSGQGTLLVNADDPAWRGIDPKGRATLTYGVDTDADVRAENVRLAPTGSTFALACDGSRVDVRLPLVGRYNVENALAAASVAIALGQTLTSVAERLRTAPQVKGRLETVAREPFNVVIDFAHTPAALEGALGALRPLTDGRLIVLFGAGGDRDRTKRRPMAEAVSRFADVAVLTSDNPRTEDPEAIIDDLVEGMGDVEFVRVADRRAAIRAALEVARPGDTVVLAGKGHETYQVIGTEKQPFDEAAITRAVLQDLEAA